MLGMGMVSWIQNYAYSRLLPPVFEFLITQNQKNYPSPCGSAVNPRKLYSNNRY